jgi:tetraacyldisaccharide 4'-kinase
VRALRAPDFWADRDSLTPKLLAPLACLYASAGRLRQMTTVPKRAGIPVICVGNLVAGGAGKTPVALSLATRLKDLRGPVQFLTRGYGGSEHGPLRVEPARHDVRQVGDEALLLAACAPTWLAHDRVAGARAAKDAGAGLLIMDDGFQNPSLHKDVSLLVIDGAFGFGNGRVIPAGPLREPASDGLSRADALVLIGQDSAGIAAQAAGRPLLRARLAPTPESAAQIAGRRVLAFAGIGRPEKFFASLRELDCDIVAKRPFADHHPYSREEFERLLADAARLDALPVTTAKDAVRLPPDLRRPIAVLDVTIAWDDEGALDRWLAERLTMLAS